MKWTWWKILAILLLLYVFSYGLLIEVPRQPIVNETIRNLFFHVPLWFAMFTLAGFSFFYSIKYLNTENLIFDTKASSFAHVAIFFGLLGLITGMIWANFSWNPNPDRFVFWVKGDKKLEGAAYGSLIYGVYLIFRNLPLDPKVKGRFSAVYNIFGFIMLMLFTSVIPRMFPDTLHPGNGGNPGFNIYDTSGSLKLVFYPAVIAFILLGYWLANLRVRITLLNHKE